MPDLDRFQAFDLASRVPLEALPERVLASVEGASLIETIFPLILEVLATESPEGSGVLIPAGWAGPAQFEDQTISLMVVADDPDALDVLESEDRVDGRRPKVDLLLVATLEPEAKRAEAIGEQLDVEEPRIEMLGPAELACILVAANRLCPGDGGWLAQGRCPACDYQASRPLHRELEIPPLADPFVWKLEDRSLFPRKRYRAHVVVDPRRSRLFLREVAKETVDQLQARRWHPSSGGREAYGERAPDGVEVVLYRGYSPVVTETPACVAREAWEEVEWERAGREPDETLASLELYWDPADPYLARPIRQGWFESLHECQEAFDEIVDEANDLHEAYEHGYMTWEQLEFRLEELERTSRDLVRRARTLFKPPKDAPELEPRFERFMMAAHDVLSPFADWNQGTGEAEERNWAFTRSTEAFEQEKDRLLEAAQRVSRRRKDA